jgi:hypothetical protein
VRAKPKILGDGSEDAVKVKVGEESGVKKDGTEQGKTVDGEKIVGQGSSEVVQPDVDGKRVGMAMDVDKADEAEDEASAKVGRVPDLLEDQAPILFRCLRCKQAVHYEHREWIVEPSLSRC